MKLGLERLGRVPPETDKLRALTRAALRAARRGRLSTSAIDLKRPTASAQELLAEFAIRRCHPKRLEVIRSPSGLDRSHTEETIKIDATEPSDQPRPTKRLRIGRVMKTSKKRPLAPHRKQQQLVLAQPPNRDLLLALKRNWKYLDLIEQADEVNSLLCLGCTQRGLAYELGVAATTIRRRVQIAHLPEEHRNAIKGGASAKTILKQMDVARINAALSARFSRPEQRKKRIDELISFFGYAVQRLEISPRMYQHLQRPVLEFVEIESKRLGPIRLPKAVKSFEKEFNASEPPPDGRRELRRLQRWIGTALARIEPDQALINAAVTETCAVLVAQNQSVEQMRRNHERIGVLEQMKFTRRKTPSGPAPLVPSRTRLNQPF